MKIVKNGRLFGKLNIVDVLILLVVIAAVAFLADGGQNAGIFVPQI